MRKVSKAKVKRLVREAESDARALKRSARKVEREVRRLKPKLH